MPLNLKSDSLYKSRQSEITKKAWQNGVYNSLIKPLETRTCKNFTCNKTFQVKPYERKIYCGSRCAAIVNNSKRPKRFNFCTVCNKQLKRPTYKYCSVQCQWHHYYKQYVERWKQGLEDGNRGINTRILSGHLRRYLKEKYGEKCSICGWNKKNSVTKLVPLEVDHIDGNSENNIEENLRLICPNCHALTPTFKNLNKGNGRAWRLKNSI